jgi:hypothetical protein
MWITSNCIDAADTCRRGAGRVSSDPRGRSPTTVEHFTWQASGEQTPTLHMGQLSFSCSTGAD